MVLPDPRDLPAPPDQRAPRVLTALPGQRDLPAPPDQRAPRVLTALPDQRDLLVLPGQRDHREYKVLTVFRVHKGRRDLRVLLDHRVLA